jgi:cyclohexyl-isocyanide hydratase
VVVDGNVVTGAGVASGIDFALALAAMLDGEATARDIQLQIEYDPAPPFDSGSPRTAAPEHVERVRKRGTELRAARETAVRRAGEKLA